ncbi:hypothetical protein ACIRSU_07535 [Streptomyces sp. NPDC101160]|uniref:hypothetical protein n=1 Tax=Streptomyces sp. NPDC101160 TaxID=3366118 RepID=UPI003803ED20
MTETQADIPEWLRLFEGLSCYTANLAGYLHREFPRTDEHFARSVRLAVRTDLPDGELSFSHHATPLDELPDGSRLRYRTAGDAESAAAELAAEAGRHGRVLVVTDSARLPWSPVFGQGPSAPHWLLVTGGAGEGRWQVYDAFAGLLPAGEQRPYAGTVTTAELLAMMTLPAGWSPAQHRRNTLAFGFPVPEPEPASGTASEPGPSALQWLAREPGPGRRPGPGPGPTAPLPGDWLTDSVSALPFLAGLLTRQEADAGRHLEDLWAATQHHVFRYRRPALRGDASAEELHRCEEAVGAWEALPKAVRFAVDSARRGRPRASLIHSTFERLLDIESRRAALPV